MFVGQAAYKEKKRIENGDFGRKVLVLFK